MFVDLTFERWQVVGFRKGERSKTFHKLHVLGMNDNLWDRVHEVGNETWKGCELVKLLVVLTRLRGTGIISLIS